MSGLTIKLEDVASLSIRAFLTQLDSISDDISVSTAKPKPRMHIIENVGKKSVAVVFRGPDIRLDFWTYVEETGADYLVIRGESTKADGIFAGLIPVPLATIAIAPLHAVGGTDEKPELLNPAHPSMTVKDWVGLVGYNNPVPNAFA